MLFPASTPGITISNSAGSFKAQGFEGQEIARAYDGSTSFSRSASGSQILGGPTYRQKYIWGVSVKCTEAQALELDAIFRQWDTQRADGIPSIVNVEDETFGATVTANAVFSTPPVFTRLSPTIYTVSLGLTEV